MKILLIYPRPNIEFDTAHNLPLGMAYIAAVLENEGHKVEILDLNVQPDNLEERLKDTRIVGIYSKTVHIKSAWKICKRIKEYNKNIFTVLGGPHPSVLPDESMNDESVDFVIRKEGEYTFKELCEAIENKRPLTGINGLSFKLDGKITHNPDRELIKNLDELPMPAYHLFPFNSYTLTRPTWLSKDLKVGTIVTSRGCPFSCNFCFQGVHGRKYRYRSPENVVKEMKFLKEKYNVNFIEIIDDNFAFVEDRAIKICELIIENKLDIKWSLPEGFARADNISRSLMKVAKKSGCIDFWLAIESGSQRVLDKIVNKGTTLSQIREAVNIAKEEGFEVGAFVCIGNFGETEEEIMETMKFVCSLDLDKCQITLVTPYPGSRLYNILKEENRLLVKDWDHYSPYENIVFFENDGMTSERILQLYKRTFRKFYLRPSYIWKTVKRPTTYKNLPLILKQIWRFLF